MDGLKRYDLSISKSLNTGKIVNAKIKENQDGKFVKYSDVEPLIEALKFASKSLEYYSKESFDRVCFLDHATCEEAYGADARDALAKIKEALSKIRKA